MMKHALCILLCLSFFVFSLAPQAETLTEYQVRAAYLYNFLKFVKWPGHAFENDHQPITIGIFHFSPVEQDLRNIIRNRTIDSRSITIKILEQPEDAQDCHVVYFGDIERRHQIATIGIVQKNPILTISDAGYFCRIGGMIYFYIEDNRLRLVINRKAVDNAQLEISARLLRVAQIVDE
ncbi:YfiR family protein [bacterium]|nr:YfiR family protein [bacterium]